ncbi:MAG: hypothetical protein HDT13_06095 [Butyrivibrio sp.]|nr:hypothetical protein [Butyrivibrio sp.]
MGIQDMLPYRTPNHKNKRLLDPHVVIIGAGASIAACKIDKNGKEVPILKNIHNVLGLTYEIEQYDFSDEQMADFEKLFSDIYGKKEYVDLQAKLEHEVCDYFSKLVIPDTPTLYDYLILSLTEKDAIISFNWDPFLIQAYRRNIIVGNLPELIFPHGNSGVGLCYDCKLKGYANCLCPNCFKDLEQMPLLYPIGKKDYNSKLIIKNEWNRARDVLSRAAGITVYGYGAPVTDIEAVELMKSANNISRMKDIAPFTIINLASNEEEQRKKWSDFYDVDMMLYCNHFEETMLWNNPRVSLETLFDAILQQQPRHTEKPFKKYSTLKELQDFVKTITEFDMCI